MLYEPLYKLYYQDEQKWQKRYNALYSSPFTYHFPFPIKQFVNGEEYPSFLCLTGEMATLQEQIMLAYLQCTNIMHVLPGIAIKQFLHTCLVSEVKSTNDIEGVHSTRKEIREALNTPEKQRYNRRLGDVVTKYDKIIQRETISLQSCQDIRNLFNSFLYHEIEKDDPKNLPDGKFFRIHDVGILSGTQKEIHKGIAGEQNIITAMDIALSILNNPSMPLIMRISLFHFFFGYIHPFYDGNGRMSRFITSYFLGKIFDPTIALQFSISINENRKKYYKLFDLAELRFNKGDLTPFVIGMMEFILDTIESTTDTLNQRKFVYQKYYRDLANYSISDKATWDILNILLQASIFSDDGASIDEIAVSLDKAKSTINAHMKNIPSELLKRIPSIRPYRYKLDLELISNPKGPVADQP